MQTRHSGLTPTGMPAHLPLSPADRKALKALAHHLDPVIMVGDAGLSAAVIAECERALKAHALIKIRVAGDDREARLAMLDTLHEQLGCEKVQTIGKLLVVYRPKPEAPAKEHIPKKQLGMETARPARRGTPRR